MAKKKELCRSASGRFVRNLGWKRTSTGDYTQHKFYLGADESKAKLASLRLEQLWEQVCRRWERENAFELCPTDRPVWDATTLPIAEAVRNGEAVAKVPLVMPFSAMIPESSLLGDWLDRLQNDITVIKIELLDAERQKHSEQFLLTQGTRLIELGRRMVHKKAGGETLHNALDFYARSIKAKHVDVNKEPTPWCGTQGRQIEFLRAHLPDAALADLDVGRVEELIETIRLRPIGKRKRPVSVEWVQGCLKTLRRFLRWLSKAADFAWRWPTDLEFARIRIPLDIGEKSSPMRQAQVETYTIDELRTLWGHATAFQRLLMLLALNCGFGRAEVASLELEEVVLHARHPSADQVGYASTACDNWIFRVRNKSRVYGEFKLWPETVEAIEAWLLTRAGIDVDSGVRTLLVNGNGHRFDTPTRGNHANLQIPNAWHRLTKAVRKQQPDFRQLSFNKLRKTAGNLIRSTADGEVASIFLCHGKPVNGDALLDVYTNRPFAKVFAAIDAVGTKLRPL